MSILTSATPLCTTPDVRRFYRGPVQDEALARLQFLVDHHCRLGLLAGGIGLGKTLILEVFAHQLQQAGRRAMLVSLLGLEANELLLHLAQAAGAWPQPNATAAELWSQLTDYLKAAAVGAAPAAVLLDDAAEASPEVLCQAIRLAQLPLGTAAPTVVLAADATRLSRLGTRLLELVELRIDLDAWELTDTEQHLREALSQAGLSADRFRRDAVCRLHELASGIPRRINQLADLALLAAAADQLPAIDRPLIDAVFDELSVVLDPGV